MEWLEAFTVFQKLAERECGVFQFEPPQGKIKKYNCSYFQHLIHIKFRFTVRNPCRAAVLFCSESDGREPAPFLLWCQQLHLVFRISKQKIIQKIKKS